MTDPLPRDRESSEEDTTPGDDQAPLIDELDHEPSEPVDFTVINDEKHSIYTVIIDDREVAGLPYNIAGADRIVLLATSVLTEFRKRGIATGLIRHALDDVRNHGKTVTAMCPIVRAFIDKNPGYADLIDTKHPGPARTADARAGT